MEKNNRILSLAVVLISVLSGFCYAAQDTLTGSNASNATEAVAGAPPQMLDFDLASYGDAGKKKWDLKGESADMLTDVVKLSNIEANFYGNEEDMNLKAEKGDYDKANSKVHLQDNVVATTSSGARLTTESLDWAQKDQKITTNDTVNIKRENMEVTATGAQAEPSLKKIYLKEDVKVDIEQKEKDKPEPSKTTITCDGPLEIDYDKETAVFNNNVVANNPTQGNIFCDKMTVHFKFKEKTIDRVVCQGNVRIVKGENVTLSEEAIYDAASKKMILTGRPQLTIFTEEGMDISAAFGAKKEK